MKPINFLLPVFAVAFASAAHAQFGSGIVFDPTQSAHAIEQIRQGVQGLQTAEQMYTTAYRTMNQVIAAYNLAYQMSKMPQNLAARYQSDFSMWTRFSSASAPDVYGNTSAWINALDLGNPTRAASAYSSAVVQVQSYPSSRMSALDSTTQATVQNQYASSEIGEANVTNLLSTLGTIRSNSETFQQKLANLESDTYSTDPSEQTSNALLGKINSATMLQIHSQQDTNQILATAALHDLVATKEQSDQQKRALNQALYFEQNFSDFMGRVTSGMTQSMNSISYSGR